jgi:hypothetical protein
MRLALPRRLPHHLRAMRRTRNEYIPPSEQARREGINAGCVLLLVTALLILWNTYEGFRIWQSESWQPAPGQVVSSRVEPGPWGQTSHAVVEYTYAVGKDQRKARNLRWATEYRLLRSSAEAEAARYPVGAPVEVFYDPENSGDAVLERGMNRHFFYDCLLSLALIAVAFLLANHEWARTAEVQMRYN